MHELGLVEDIVCAIKARLKGSGENSKVKRVNILIGELEQVTPGHFEFHFRERTKGTLLEGAELNFKTLKARFRCKNCSCEFSAPEGLDGCPDCKSNVNEVIEGAGITVESVEIDE